MWFVCVAILFMCFLSFCELHFYIYENNNPPSPIPQTFYNYMIILIIPYFLYFYRSVLMLSDLSTFYKSQPTPPPLQLLKFYELYFSGTEVPCYRSLTIPWV